MMKGVAQMRWACTVVHHTEQACEDLLTNKVHFEHLFKPFNMSQLKHGLAVEFLVHTHTYKEIQGSTGEHAVKDV